MTVLPISRPAVAAFRSIRLRAQEPLDRLAAGSGERKMIVLRLISRPVVAAFRSIRLRAQETLAATTGWEGS